MARRAIGAVAISTAVVLAACRSVGPPPPSRLPARPPAAVDPRTLTDVLLVGNSVAGTVSFLTDEPAPRPIGTVNIIPDLKTRLHEIRSPLKFWRGVIYDGIRHAESLEHFEPDHGNRFIDDMFLSNDGRILYVSRANLGDMAAFDLSKPGSDPIWRTTVGGRKADHATISHDGTTIIVSASVVRKAFVLDAATGAVLTSFRTGLLPHQNDYSYDGKHIYNGSLGRLSLPFAKNDRKGDRALTKVDAETFQVIKAYPFDRGVRPTAITRDEKTAYIQLSYLNGLVKFDLTTGVIVETSLEPKSRFAEAHYPSEDDYPHNSAHHGLALSADETLLCDCGTIDNTVSIVSTRDLKDRTVLPTGAIPYWATTSADDNRCYVSLSGEDAVAVIDYRNRREIARVPVGAFPQRNRLGKLAADLVPVLSGARQAP
jgi:YVTN family beta-propeller protein